MLKASRRRFGAKTAPAPSLWLLAPVAAFCVAATFVAVYWPRRIQPDGGRGSLEGAGASLADPAGNQNRFQVVVRVGVYTLTILRGAFALYPTNRSQTSCWSTNLPK